MEPIDCSKYNLCANAETLCHICKNFSAFKPGASYGKGNRAERKVAKAVNTNATLRKGSGASAIAKGDVIDSDFLHEVKTGYGTKSMTVQRAWLLKIQREAIAEGKFPVLDIIFDQAPDEIWSIVDSNALLDLKRELNELRKKLNA